MAKPAGQSPPEEIPPQQDRGLLYFFSANNKNVFGQVVLVVKCSGADIAFLILPDQGKHLPHALLLFRFGHGNLFLQRYQTRLSHGRCTTLKAYVVQEAYRGMIGPRLC